MHILYRLNLSGSNRLRVWNAFFYNESPEEISPQLQSRQRNRFERGARSLKNSIGDELLVLTVRSVTSNVWVSECAKQDKSTLFRLIVKSCRHGRTWTLTGRREPPGASQTNCLSCLEEQRWLGHWCHPRPKHVWRIWEDWKMLPILAHKTLSFTQNLYFTYSIRHFNCIYAESTLRNTYHGRTWLNEHNSLSKPIYSKLKCGIVMD